MLKPFIIGFTIPLLIIAVLLLREREAKPLPTIQPTEPCQYPEFGGCKLIEIMQQSNNRKDFIQSLPKHTSCSI
jgi:hypothetical protein